VKINIYLLKVIIDIYVSRQLIGWW